MTARAPSFDFLDDMEEELASRKRVLDRFSDGHGDRPPHEKSKTLAELARHMADIRGLAGTILETEEMNALARPPREPSRTAAELGVYYRPLNVPIPSVYGPTADEPFRG